MEWINKDRIPDGKWPFLMTIRVGLEELQAALPESQDITEGNGAITITGCLEAYRQAVIRRTLDLAQAIITCWNAGHLVGAMVCGRALLETIATFHSLLVSSKIASDKFDWAAIGRLVDSYAFSVSPNRKGKTSDLDTPPRVGRMVKDFLQSTQPEALEFWDQICEVAHPNGERMLRAGGELRDGRYDAPSISSNEAWLFPAIHNCLQSINWLSATMLDFDILLEEIRNGGPLTNDHKLMRDRALVDRVVTDVLKDDII
jgi:hypothetical protein